jgi:hypothetical protein
MIRFEVIVRAEFSVTGLTFYMEAGSFPEVEDRLYNHTFTELIAVNQLGQEGRLAVNCAEAILGVLNPVWTGAPLEEGEDG